ncbi:hypothetical protein DBR11_21275 [Pedobacter sp. HMWF019]|uniref:PKD domain-containing protein n=1 Tax=Pedobacter sp. HMWF019 TaxID=2056856 RepID=UPI000D3AC9D1|nr:PKD domain-containing protein [Pedobacter sp. HMWF019]PTS95479.1 hypothetical protein DBR11_21275 [Pedobacter sp. HMWF019]
MNNRISYIFATLFILFAVSCKKNKEQPVEVPESQKPTASFNYKQVSVDDPFTFKFENLSKDFKEVRWEFGDDSTTTEVSPVHTFINTGEYRIKMVSKNDQGYWAQREVKIKLNPDSILSYTSANGADGKITLSLNPPVKAETVSWYKLIGTKLTLVETAPTTKIAVAAGTYDTYEVRITTPKGSKAEVTRLVGSAGVLNDITGNAVFSVSRDNDNGATSNEGSLKLIDKDTRTKFLQFNYKGDLWAQLDYKNNPVVLGAYSLTSGDDAIERDPKNFNLQGSNDLTSWTVVDQRTNEAFATRGLTKMYIFDNSTPYRYYRLNIPVNNGAGLIQIAEWRVFVMQ